MRVRPAEFNPHLRGRCAFGRRAVTAEQVLELTHGDRVISIGIAEVQIQIGVVAFDRLPDQQQALDHAGFAGRVGAEQQRDWRQPNGAGAAPNFKVFELQVGQHFIFRSLHVIAVPNLWSIMLFQVFHDLPHLSCATERNGVLSIQLGVVPVHFCQPKNLFGKKCGALL